MESAQRDQRSSFGPLCNSRTNATARPAFLQFRTRTALVAKKTIRDVPLHGRKVLIRADFNVPLTDNGEISSDRRIRCTLPTIRVGLDGNAAVILMSHLGRPTGEPK